MWVARPILVSAVVVLLTVACGPAAAQTPAAPSADPRAITPTQQPSASATVVWGRVPYCNCFADSATGNVDEALKAAKLAVSLQELSPREGWLYFAVTFDPGTATKEDVSTAMMTGGAEVLEQLP